MKISPETITLILLVCHRYFCNKCRAFFFFFLQVFLIIDNYWCIYFIIENNTCVVLLQNKFYQIFIPLKYSRSIKIIGLLLNLSPKYFNNLK
jgi:hypothetical protein